MGEELLEPYLRWARIRRIINYIPKGVLVDVGCGKGQLLKSVSNRIVKGIGLDMINNKKEGNIEFKKVKLNKKISLSSDSVNCITMLACFEHLDHPIKMLMECYRILKNGGVLLITSPTPRAKIILEFLSYKLNIISPKQIRDHKNYFSKAQLRKILINKCKFRRVISKTFQFGFNNLTIAYK